MEQKRNREGGDDDMKFENIIHRSIFHEYQAWPGDSYQSNDSNGLRLGVEWTDHKGCKEEGVRGSIYHSASIHDPHFSISIFSRGQGSLEERRGRGVNRWKVFAHLETDCWTNRSQTRLKVLHGDKIKCWFPNIQHFFSGYFWYF